MNKRRNAYKIGGFCRDVLYGYFGYGNFYVRKINYVIPTKLHKNGRENLACPPKSGKMKSCVRPWQRIFIDKILLKCNRKKIVQSREHQVRVCVLDFVWRLFQSKCTDLLTEYSASAIVCMYVYALAFFYIILMHFQKGNELNNILCTVYYWRCSFHNHGQYFTINARFSSTKHSVLKIQQPNAWLYLALCYDQDLGWINRK